MTTARETQKVVEVFSDETATTRETQKVVEAFHSAAPQVRATQDVLEAWYQQPTHARETQKVVEVWYFLAPPIAITGPRRQWGLHECTSKFRTEQSA